MPYKKCEACGELNGVRAKACKKCSAVLTKKEKSAKIASSMHIEKNATGTWVYDHKKGMPDIEYPEPIGTTTLSNSEIKENIEYHGLGYCIFYYISSKKIQDAELAEKWKKAKEAILAVQDYLYGDV